MHTTQMEISLTLTVGGVYDRRDETWDQVEIEDMFLSRGGKQIDVLRDVDRRAAAVQAILANLTDGICEEVEDLLTADYFADFIP